MQRENLHALWELPKGYFIFPTEIEYLPSSLSLDHISAFVPKRKIVIQIGDTFLLSWRSEGEFITKFVGTFLGMNGINRTYPLPTHHRPPSEIHAVFRIFIIVGEDADDPIHHQLPPIEYASYPYLLGVQQVVATNIGVCVSINNVGIPVIIFHAEEVESCFPPILKGASNAYFVMKIISFSNHSHDVVVNDLMRSHHCTFSHQWSSHILPHSYNYRLYSQLCALSQLVNTKLNCRRQYDVPRFVESMPFLLEAWEHLVGRLEGGDVLVRRNLTRVRCYWHNDLSTEKVRVGGQTSWEIRVRTTDQLDKLRGVMGVAFGVGVKRRLRFGDGRVGVHVGDTLFALDVGDDGDRDLLLLRYDVGASKLTIVMEFTRLLVSDIADPVAQRIIASIKYSMMQLFASQQVEMNTNFFYCDSMYLTHNINNGIVTCNKEEGDGANQIHLPMDECAQLINVHNS